MEQELNNKPLFVESHAHLNLLNEDLKTTVDKCRRENIKYILNVGYDLQSSEYSYLIAKRYNEIFCSIGIHPHYINSVNLDELDKILGKLISAGIVALGEIGLDYIKSNAKREDQIKYFERQLSIAKCKNLPVIIHNREADNDILSIIDKFSSMRGVFHCFSSDKIFAKKVLDRGFYISFAGNITYPKNEELRNILKWIPIDFLLLETDSPYLSPQPLRGKDNHPTNLKLIYELAARLKEVSIIDLSERIYKNFLNLFLKGVVAKDG